jgi:hypothetical protein
VLSCAIGKLSEGAQAQRPPDVQAHLELHPTPAPRQQSHLIFKSNALASSVLFHAHHGFTRPFTAGVAESL